MNQAADNEDEAWAALQSFVDVGLWLQRTGEITDLAGASWVNSPFEWVYNMKPVPKSKALSLCLRTWLQQNGLSAQPLPARHGLVAPWAWAGLAGLCVSGEDMFLRCSLLWGKREFRFQQIRNTELRRYLLLGIAPLQVYLWVVPTAVLVVRGTDQHGSDREKWVRFDPHHIPEWLAPYGGTLNQGLQVLRRGEGINDAG